VLFTLFVIPLFAVPTGAGEGWGFVEVTLAAGITNSQGYVETNLTAPHRFGGGVAAGDYDGDGWVDLLVLQGTLGPKLLYRNLGDGTFEEVGAVAGLSAIVKPYSGPAFGDLDGDGDLDLWIGGIGQGIETYRNLGDGTFETVDIASPVFPVTLSPTFGDLDGDGDLDAALPQWNMEQTELLWRNDGPFVFSSMDTEALLPADRAELLNTFTANFTDLDTDGDLDIVIASDFNSSQVLRSNGDGTFERSTDPQVIVDENGMGAAVGDFDLDGIMDWFVTSIWADWNQYGNRLYKGVGDGTFVDVTDAAGVADGSWGWGSCFADFDNDGDLDIFHVNGYSGPDFSNDLSRLFVNQGDGTFIEEAIARGIEDDRQGRGVVCFDHDRDGDLDLFIANNFAAPRLYRNDGGNLNHWLAVRLQGEAPNTEGIGARLELENMAGVVLVREMHCGSNYVSQNPSSVHFGLGTATSARTLDVTWPDGQRSRVAGPAADRELAVEAGLILRADFESGDFSGWQVVP
jgi:hypothetical protein